ncbi:DHA2 family efflux MFS transporter permease subunit [Rhodanobacter glycinis]|uniref:MFS transporter n=1 Tax=Rhodanobacter glycinis TaxID=582702 RepID=UPI00112DF529|nr:MFS transporter [Rhodanobacter glycinis]TPG50032.1 DHA2 family efflux MFS transporter permease subunit [Rhodanobacter glycinis]
MNTTISDARRANAHPNLILGICCLSLLMVAMDATIVNVALPSIRRDLAASVSGLQWVIDAYTMVVASLLMLAGSMADRFGRRRVFQLGMALFLLGSLLCSVAPDIHGLVAFRILQALGATMLNPVAMSIIANTFTEPRARARAIGVWGAVAGVAMALGPVIGGALTESIGWRSIFWVNLPIGAAAMLLAARYIPESRAPRARRVDPLGQLLVLVILAAVTYAVIEGPHDGWGSITIIGLFAAAALSLVALLVYEPRRHEPLIDVRFFRSAPFSSATLIAICSFSAFSGFLFLNALYLQEVRGLSAFHTGLCTLPLALATILCSPLSGRLVGSYGTLPSLLASGTATAVSALMMTQLTATTPLPFLLLTYAIFGIGFGMVNAPITHTAVSGMPKAQAGLAAAVASTSRQIGASLGVALAGTILAGHVRNGFAEATHPFWWIITGGGVTVLFLAWLSTTRWARDTTRHAAHLLEEAPAGAPA